MTSIQRDLRDVRNEEFNVEEACDGYSDRREAR